MNRSPIFMLGMILPLALNALANTGPYSLDILAGSVQPPVDCPLLGLNIGDPCDDGDPCTAGETVDGACNCTGGVPLNCDDGDACTTDLCLMPGTCLAPDNSSGTADLPAAVCSYMA
ncbi:MAG: hypothetical protein KIT10_02770 [Flavobacteriales bacterium]|nr:hypothetical protein [Flavobacteriales bacterium]